MLKFHQKLSGIGLATKKQTVRVDPAEKRTVRVDPAEKQCTGDRGTVNDGVDAFLNRKINK